jgi:hypothetical protein
MSTPASGRNARRAARSLPPRETRWKLGCIGWTVIILVVLLAIGILRQPKPTRTSRLNLIDVIDFLLHTTLVGLIGITYFLPAIWASYRNHPHRDAIGILNFFFGWTVLGWFLALLWAATATPQSHARAGRR